MKRIYFYAVAAIALAGCANDEFIGREGPTTKSATIEFSGQPTNLTRALSKDLAAEKLEGSFDLFGTKGDGVAVFAQSAATAGAIAKDKTYKLWYNGEANTTSSNVAGWEYVGTGSPTAKYTPAGGTETTKAVTLNGNQTLKYWDYTVDKYDFIAFKDLNAASIITSNVTTAGFTVKGSSSQLANFYVADKRVVAKADFGQTVTFTFRNAGAKVRLGIYETIPGYKITDIKFQPTAAGAPTGTPSAALDGKFVGGTSGEITGTVKFEDPTVDNSRVKVVYEAADATDYFDFGTVTATETTPMNTAATTPSWAIVAGVTDATTGYTPVIPNLTNVGDMTLTVDYTLTAEDGSGETITVTGATATVPEAYMVWQSNYAYTYLFKISDKTNGNTGTPGTDPSGLYPITFDAVVIATEDGSTQETITAVEDYAITTYQEGSQVTETATTEYTNAEKIYAVLTHGGAVTAPATTTDANKNVAGNGAYFKIGGTKNDGTTVTEKDIVEVLNGVDNGLTLTYETSTAETYTLTLPDGTSKTANAVTFTPSAAATQYAYVYCVSAYNAGAGWAAPTAAYDAATQYYTKATDGKCYPATGVTAENYTSFFVPTTAPVDGVFAVKVITVK